jgi:subtilisin
MTHRHRARRLAVLLCVLTLSAVPAIVSAQPGPPARFIVVLHDHVDPFAVANEHAAVHGLAISHVYESALKGYAAPIPAARLALIQADPRVQFVSDDRPVSAIAQTLPTGVNRIDADTSSTVANNGSGTVNVPVAIIDTGIDTSHPDLNVVGGKNCQFGGTYKDGNGHGTHVAGTVGARDNGLGVVGVAPGTPLYAARVLNNAGSGSWSTVICGINWVTQNAGTIKVANMSLGGSGSDDGNCGNTNNDALHKAICGSVAAGVTYVVAAGNDGVDFSGFVPAAYNEVLTVTAMADFDGIPGGGGAPTCRADVDETPADFSNYTAIGSPDSLHTIAAPGVCIYSTWKGGGYNTISGTSMASPHVAGTAALCIESIETNHCGGTPANVITRLRSDAAAQDPLYGFLGDPNHVILGRAYGYLLRAGAY